MTDNGSGLLGRAGAALAARSTPVYVGALAAIVVVRLLAPAAGLSPPQPLARWTVAGALAVMAATFLAELTVGRVGDRSPADGDGTGDVEPITAAGLLGVAAAGGAALAGRPLVAALLLFGAVGLLGRATGRRSRPPAPDDDAAIGAERGPAAPSPGNGWPDGPDAVVAHVHFGMTGVVPMRLAELVFAETGLYVLYYGRITVPMGVAVGSPKRAAAEMAHTVRTEGYAAARDRADTVDRLPYPTIDRVVLHDGGRLSRERIAVHRSDGAVRAYRIHAPVDLAVLAETLSSLGDRAGFAVERRRGAGLRERVGRSDDRR